MNTNICFVSRSIRDENKPKFKLVCSCGNIEYYDDYGEVLDIKRCPKCGGKLCEISWRDDPNNYIERFFEYDVQDKVFRCKKIECFYKVSRDTYRHVEEVKLKQFHVYETKIDLMNENQKLKLIVDEQDISNTKKNLQKCMSYFPTYKLRNYEETIFGQVYIQNIVRSDAGSSIIYYLIKHPEIEILYNTYKELDAIYDFEEKLFKDKTKPNEILDISKPICKKWFNDWHEKVEYKKYFIFEIVKELDHKFFSKPDVVINILDNAFNTFGRIDHIDLKRFIDIVTEYNYDPQNLSIYLRDSISLYQAIDDPSYGLRLLYDYIMACKELDVKYEKYPKSLKLIHDVSTKNVTIKENEKLECQFVDKVNQKEYKDLEYFNKDFCVICPKNIEDLINEGNQLHHCVGSYTKRIIDGLSKILFYRKSNKKETPLVTLEVIGRTCSQHRGFFDRDCTEKELHNIKIWAKEKGLKVI